MSYGENILYIYSKKASSLAGAGFFHSFVPPIIACDFRVIFDCKTVTRDCKNAFKTVFYRLLKKRTERDSNIYKALFSPIYNLLFFSYGILAWNEFLTGAILFF